MECHKSQKQHDDDLAKRRIKRKAKKEVERKQDKTFWTWFIAIVVCVCVVGALVVKVHSRSAAHKRIKDELDQNGGAKGKGRASSVDLFEVGAAARPRQLQHR